jgi:hypothetical protein
MLPVLPDSVESSRRIAAGSVTAVSERPQRSEPGPSGRGSGAATRRSPSGPMRSSKSGT